MLTDIANKIRQSKFHWTDIAIRIGIDKNDIFKIKERNDSPSEFVHSVTQKLWDEIFHFVGLNVTDNGFTEISSISKLATILSGNIGKDNHEEKHFEVIQEIANRISQWKEFGRILNLAESFLNQLQTDCSSISERNRKIIERFSMPLHPNPSWMFWRQYLHGFDDGKLVIEEMEGKFIDLLPQIPNTVAHIVTTDQLTYIGHPFQYRENQDYLPLDKEKETLDKKVCVRVGSEEYQCVDYKNFSEWIQSQEHYMDTYNMLKDLKAINFDDDNIIQTLNNYLDEKNDSGFVMKGYNFVNSFCLIKQGVFAKDVFNDSYFSFLANDNVALYLTKCSKGPCHALHHSLRNVQIANILHSELQSTNITQINIIIHDKTNDNTKFCKQCINNDLFVNEQTFTDVAKFTLWYNKLIANNNIQKKVNQPKDSKTGNKICKVVKKDMITYQALETSNLPSFSYCPEDQMDELKKLVVLSPNQFKAVHSNKKHILIRGSYGCGKSLVLFKKFDDIVNNMTDSEIVYFICNDQQSDFVQYMKILQGKYHMKNIIICRSDQLTTKTRSIPKLSFILNHIKHVWKDKLVHILIDEFSGSYFNNSEIEDLKIILHSFQSSYIIIALQSMEQNIVEIENKEMFSDFGYQFSKLIKETSFTFFNLDYSLRNSSEINEFVEATAKILESSTVSVAAIENFASTSKLIVDSENGMERHQTWNEKAAIVTSYKYNQNESIGHALKSGLVNVYDCNSDVYNFRGTCIVYFFTLEYILKDLSEFNKYVICTYDENLYNAIRYFLNTSLLNWTTNINQFMKTNSTFTVLLTDYAAVRGCEFNNFIFLAPLGKRFLKYRMLECFTRCTSRLHIISDELGNDSIDRQLMLKWKQLDCVYFIDCTYEKSGDKVTLVHDQTEIYRKENAWEAYNQPYSLTRYPWRHPRKVENVDVSNVQDDLWIGLRCVVSMDNIYLFNYFIKLHNIDINDQNLLHIASEYDAVCLSQILIKDYKVDVNSTDHYNTTPLYSAACYGSSNVVDILIKNGADVNVEKTSGKTPLIISSEKGYTNIVQLLLNSGADVNVKDMYGETALHVSSEEGYTNIVQLLLNNGADGNVKNNSVKTALHISSDKGYTNIVQLLLDNGADVNVKNEYDNTPLNVSSSKGYIKIVQLLLNNGGDVNIKNEDGETAIDRADYFGHRDIVELLNRYKS